MLALLSLCHTVLGWLDSRMQNRSDRGEVSIEYVLVGGLAGLAIIAGMALFDDTLVTWFTNLGTKVGGVFT